MNLHTSNTENREQTFDEKLAAIIWELTDSSGWDLIGITQAQADALSEQLRSERAEAKQAIKTLVLEDVIPTAYPRLVQVEDLPKSPEEHNRTVKLLDTYKSNLHQIINPQKEGE